MLRGSVEKQGWNKEETPKKHGRVLDRSNFVAADRSRTGLKLLILADRFPAMAGAEMAVDLRVNCLADEFGRGISKRKNGSTRMNAVKTADAIQWVRCDVAGSPINGNFRWFVVEWGENVVNGIPHSIGAGVLGSDGKHASAATLMSCFVDAVEISFGPDLAHIQARSASRRRRRDVRIAHCFANHERVGCSIDDIRKLCLAVDVK